MGLLSYFFGSSKVINLTEFHKEVEIQVDSLSKVYYGSDHIVKNSNEASEIEQARKLAFDIYPKARHLHSEFVNKLKVVEQDKHLYDMTNWDEHFYKIKGGIMAINTTLEFLNDTLELLDKRCFEKSDEYEKFSSISEMIEMHIVGSTMFYENAISKLSQDQEKLYFAFELGVIEYFERAYLRSGDKINSDTTFFNFLIFHANKKYGENSEDVFQLWKSLTVHGLLHNERKLGYDSVNEQSNTDGSRREGHFPGAYLKKAVGF